MHTILRTAALLAAMASVGVAANGCTADIHDNTVNVDATVEFKTTVDVDHVKPGDSVAVTMNATGVVLVEPDKTPAPADVDKAAYFKIFLDDTAKEPLLVTAQASATVTIPAATPEGKHKLICRLHKHDGTATDKQQEISITVSASATVTVGGDAGK
jgi:hypothetical protein